MVTMIAIIITMTMVTMVATTTTTVIYFSISDLPLDFGI
jgi:hypothetical protein